MIEYWIEKKTGRFKTLGTWEYEWKEAARRGKLQEFGWADTWERQKKTVLASMESMRRKRKPGGGRKPNPDKMLIKQICLTREQGEAVKLAARMAGISQSAWIREAVTARLVS